MQDRQLNCCTKLCVFWVTAAHDELVEGALVLDFFSLLKLLMKQSGVGRIVIYTLAKSLAAGSGAAISCVLGMFWVCLGYK